MSNIYNEEYKREGYYWGKIPSKMVYDVLKLFPPTRPVKLLDMGCGEGRDAVFFARNGFEVTAFDLAESGLEKARKMAREAGVSIKLFQADINEFRLSENYDILYSNGTLHYMLPELREEIIQNYKAHTSDNGLHVFSVFVEKPFIEKAPENEPHAQKWISGELLNHYHDWKLEYCTEEIFDCMSSGIPHKHAVNRIYARKITSEK